ncbi:MAG: hypothetical protein JXR96_25180 [Deltaproteobacteria bacterium]|nr:hypothetical protein [Deltaproteobacteria bacterium]
MLETISDERMYRAGLLRIVMKMRKDRVDFERCFEDVKQELRLHPEGFRSYVNHHMSELVASVKTTGSRIYWEL